MAVTRDKDLLGNIVERKAGGAVSHRAGACLFI